MLVVLLGVVLLAGAAAVAVPSRYEGFGLPVAEAMAAGRPVVASNSAALPEVVGDAGVLVDPDDVQGWTDALDGILGDPVRAESLAVAGRERARNWTAERCGSSLAAAYRDVAMGRLDAPDPAGR